jgi:prepilin-type N-terminal cleavage/methylation domain-containing protein
MVMHRNGNSTGFSLIEVLIVITIMSILTVIVGPSVLKAIQSDTIVKSAAKTLIADLKSAQNEAVLRGGGEMSTAGVLVRRSAFVVFPKDTNTYQVYSYTDSDGDNIRDDGEAASIRPAKVLPHSVRFGASSLVTKRACKGTAIEAPQVSGMSFLTHQEPPCNGEQCLEMNGHGFPSGSNSIGGTIYLTNETDNYAVHVNPAGNFMLCRWPQGATSWEIVH